MRKNIADEVDSLPVLSDATVFINGKKLMIIQRTQAHNRQRGNLLERKGDSNFDRNNYADWDYFPTAMKGEFLF